MRKLRNHTWALAAVTTAALTTGAVTVGNQTAQAATVPSDQDLGQPATEALPDQQQAAQQAYQAAAQANQTAQAHLRQAQASQTAATDAAQALQTTSQATQDAEGQLARAQAAYQQASQGQPAAGALSQATTALSQAQATSQAAQTQLQQAMDQQSQAQSAVTTANQARQAAQQTVTQQQAALATATAALKQAQTALAQAQAQSQQIAADQANLADKQAAQAAADQAVAAAQTTLKQAQAQVATLTQAVAQATADNLAVPAFHFNTNQIQLTQALVKEWAAYCQNLYHQAYVEHKAVGYSTADIEKLPSFAAWQAALSYTGGNGSNENLAKQLGVDWHDDNPVDQATMLDLNNLALDQAQELSTWTAAVLNAIRDQLGITDTVGSAVATLGMAAMTQQVAHLTSENNQSGNGHYLYGLDTAEYDYGLTSSKQYMTAKYQHQSFHDNDFGETAVTGGLPAAYGKYSMATAKQEIVYALIRMIVRDTKSHMGHTTAIFGLQNMIDDIFYHDHLQGQMVGAAISGNDNLSPRYTLHIIILSRNLAVPGTGTYRNLVQNPTMQKNQVGKQLATPILVPDLAQAQADLQTAQTQATTAQTAVTHAQTDQATAAAAVKAAQEQVAQDQAHAPAVVAAQGAVAQAQDEVTSQQRALATAQTALQTAAADQAAATKIAAQATTAVAQARQTVATQAAQVATAQARVDQLKAAAPDLARAQAQLVAAQAALKTAQAQQAQAQLRQTTAAQAAAHAEAGLAQAQAAATSAAAALKDAEEQAAQAAAALAAARAHLMTDASVYGPVIVVADQTVVQDHPVPAPQLLNPQVATTQPIRLRGNYLMLLTPTQLAAIPAGTMASWANPAQVRGAGHQVGNYLEAVLVTFPDGSTVTKTMTLHVVAAPAAGAGSGQPEQSAPQPAPGNSAPTSPRQPVAAFGPVTPPAVTATPGRSAAAVQGATRLTAGALTGHGPQAAIQQVTVPAAKAAEVPGSASAKARLPQTGNQPTAGLVAWGLSLVTTLGAWLGWRRRPQR